MKIFLKTAAFLFFVLFFLTSCGTDRQENSRAYAEGKISGNNLNFLLIKVELKDKNQLIAEVIPSENGQFILSGPLLTDSFSLEINKKIKSFSASKSGCVLSADSLKIIVPVGITYITFNEIIVE